MEFDASAYQPLEALHNVGSTATGVSFTTNTGDILEITGFGEGVFRVRVGPTTKPDYGLIAARAQRCDVIAAAPGVWTISNGNTELELTGQPLGLRVSRAEREVLASTSDRRHNSLRRLPALGRHRSGQHWIAALALTSGEAVYGLGEQFGPLNRRGQIIESVAVNHGDNPNRSSSKTIPFCWSSGVASANNSAWGILVNTPANVTHAIGSSSWSYRSYAIAVDDTALDVFIVTSSDPASLLETYAQLTGRPAGVPLWSLGLWVSRASFRQPEQVARVAAKLRVRKIPFDTVMLDASSAWNVNTQFDFEWDPKRYPDPELAIGAIKRQAPRLSVWQYPYISIESPLFHELAAKRFLLTNDHGEPYILAWHAHMTPDTEAPSQSGIIDFTNPAAYAWWRDAHEPLFAAGVDTVECDVAQSLPWDSKAFNGDLGFRLNHVYPRLHQQCVSDAAAKFAPSSSGKPIVWGQAGWIGSQRTPLQAATAAQNDWEGLAATVRGALSYGMSGVPFYGVSVSAAYSSSPPSDELYLRWLQLAVFSSHLRIEGDELNEPWALSQSNEAIAKTWLQFRYRLLPYLQTVVSHAVNSALPVMRAMPLAFPHNALTRGYDTQFMFGDSLLVAAVVRPGGEVEVALPPGAWYDLATRQRLPGRQVMRYRTPLDRFPVFGREGHILPLGPSVQHSAEINQAAPLEELWVFGKPSRPLSGFVQVELSLSEQGPAELGSASGVKVEVFGDASSVSLRSLD